MSHRYSKGEEKKLLDLVQYILPQTTEQWNYIAENLVNRTGSAIKSKFAYMGYTQVGIDTETKKRAYLLHQQLKTPQQSFPRIFFQILLSSLLLLYILTILYYITRKIDLSVSSS